jgi:hypothetical protein
MAFSDYLEDKLLKHTFANTAFTTPGTVFLGLFTAAPSDDRLALAQKSQVDHTLEFHVLFRSVELTRLQPLIQAPQNLQPQQALGDQLVGWRCSMTQAHQEICSHGQH